MCLRSYERRANGARVRLWKRELQRFADETGLAVTVVHLPPGTSKWNRAEHRLFAYICRNWRGKRAHRPRARSRASSKPAFPRQLLAGRV
jgi:hypothetical protein